MVLFTGGLGVHFFPGFGVVIQLIILCIVVGVIFWAVQSGRILNESAEEILKKRLVKGEISKKEYKELLLEISEVDEIEKSTKEK